MKIDTTICSHCKNERYLIKNKDYVCSKCGYVLSDDEVKVLLHIDKEKQ